MAFKKIPTKFGPLVDALYSVYFSLFVGGMAIGFLTCGLYLYISYIRLTGQRKQSSSAVKAVCFF